MTQLVPDQVGQASSYGLRNAENSQNIHAGTQLCYKSFLPSVVRDCNALPVLSRNSPTVESFKRSLSTNLRETPSRFYVGDRLGQIHHARLRTNCSPLNYYLYHINIIEDQRCTCGLPETNKHFLLECRKYNAIKLDMLHDVSEFCQRTLHTLLFGNMALTNEANELIFKYVHKFIQRSKRFEISS